MIKMPNLPWQILLKFKASRSRVRYIVVSTTITLLATLAALLLVNCLPVPGVHYDLPQQGPSTGLTIGMVTQYVDVNVDSKSVMVEWYPQSLQDSGMLVDIYFDPNILIQTAICCPESAVLSSEPPSKPIFQFNTSHGTWRSSTNVFRTVTTLVPSPSINDPSGNSMQDYPWDTFTTQLHLFAVNNATGGPVGINITQIFGTPVNFNVKVRQDKSSNYADGLWYQLDVSRSAGVKTLVIVVVVTFWLVGISFLWIATAYVMHPNSVAEGMYGLPMATLFAFTSLRANLPGAPAGFGARIDFVGVLPNLALLALSSVVMLMATLFHRMHNSDGGSRLELADGIQRKLPTPDTYPATGIERNSEMNASAVSLLPIRNSVSLS